MLADIKVIRPNQKHYDIIADVCGESDILFKCLGSQGFKVMVTVNNKPVLIFIFVHGSKEKHGYIAELWIDGSKFSKKILSNGIKMFNIKYSGWQIFYHSNVAYKFKRHSELYKKNMFRYTGVL
jgi:hypothetical protein